MDKTGEKSKTPTVYALKRKKENKNKNGKTLISKLGILINHCENELKNESNQENNRLMNK